MTATPTSLACDIGYEHRARLVIRDRGDQYTGSFDNVFAAIGADAIHTPSGAPWANAFAEQWIGSIQRELLE
ncbi:MAG: transposase family protein [Actinomycetia bacterium]|nr:transposase family protein [Actinomycetes bacterium]